jgi:manganese efflux pump family protein
MMLVKIIALVLPLGLDTFAASLMLGVGGVSIQQRIRASMLFTAFEATMPLVGLAIGRGLGNALGNTAEYVAIGVLFALAIQALGADEDDREPGSLLGRGIVASVALGLSISLDELAIGFAFGLLRLPVVPVVALIALQTFIVAQVGMRVGEGIGQRVRKGAEPLAGVVFALLAIGLLVAILAG